MEIKGFAHVNFTVGNFEGTLPFYKKLFACLGLKEKINADGYYFCVGRRVGMGIQRCTEAHVGARFDQGRTGLHHCCLALASREDVDALAAFVRAEDATIVREPGENLWAPGMYSMLFEDPEGIRIEASHLPRRG